MNCCIADIAMLFTAAVKLTGVCNVPNGATVTVFSTSKTSCEKLAGTVGGAAVGNVSDFAVVICEIVAGLAGGAAVGNVAGRA